MLCYINRTCSSAFYYLYNIRRIRKYLSRPITESLVHAFITSRVDYCNSLLYGIPNSHIMNLQRIQNAAARLVTGEPRFCHVTPLLFHLHWLPISYRINFKILLLTFKCLYGLAPNYLIDLISIKKQSRYSLRSNDSLLRELPSTKTRSTLGDRAFQSAAPYLWNALPSTIRNIKTLDTFKTAVKTHFFKVAPYSFWTARELISKISRWRELSISTLKSRAESRSKMPTNMASKFLKFVYR